MGILSILLLVLFVLASLLLIVIVLVQDDQGEGLGGLFGGGGATSFGSRSGNILTRITTVLGAVFLVSAFVLAWLNKTPEAGDVLGAARRGAAQEDTVDAWWILDDETSTPTGTLEAGDDDTSPTGNDSSDSAGDDSNAESGDESNAESAGSNE